MQKRKMTVQIVLVTGGRGAGKDTVARVLSERHGFGARSFADPLRALAAKAYGLPAACFIDRHAKDSPLIPELAARVCGLPGIPASPTPRDVLIRLGDAMRSTMGNEIFAASMAERLSEEAASDARPLVRFVVPDCRVPYEAALSDRVRMLLGARGVDARVEGIVVRVSRPGHDNEGLTHETDVAFRQIPADVMLANSGTLAEMEEMVDTVAADLEILDGLD